MDVHNGGIEESKSQAKKILKTMVPNKSVIHMEPGAKTKGRATNSKAGKDTGIAKELNPSDRSDRRRKTKTAEQSDAKQELKTTEESSSKKEVTVDESKAKKETDGQEEKELSRPGSKNVRTCMTCGLQEPAPKVFKKCKR